MSITHSQDKPSSNYSGQNAEQLALDHLQQQGLTLLERNYRCRGGEIDLIMQEAKSLVFVEVRYRVNDAFGSALESVNRPKQQRLRLAANHYLSTHPAAARQPARFDVVGISGKRCRIDWVRNAFD